MAGISSLKQYHQVLGCKWEPTGVQSRVATILSKMIKYRGEKLFRAGLKNQATSSTLLFMTFDLAKVGIHEVVILYKSPTNERLLMAPITEKSTAVRPHPVQLYSVQLAAPQSGNPSFAFEVYISIPELKYIPSLAYYFSVQPIDQLLGQQLWSASVNQAGTDFEFSTTGGRSLFAHKFILAARSTMFAARFSAITGEQESARKMHFHDASSLKQFLKFIYLGELDGAVNPRLLKLATIFKVPALVSLCEDGLRCKDKLAEDLANLTMLLRTNPDVLEIKPNTDLEMVLQRDACIVSITWKVPSHNEEAPFESSPMERSKVSGAFSLDSGEIFSAKVTLKRRQEVLVYFLVHLDPAKSCSGVEQVACALEDYVDHIDMPSTADRAISQTQMFTISIPSVQRCPDTITFHVKLASKIPNFNYSFRDRFGEDIWALVLSQKFTDVELILASRTFRAHRALLSARSPVFKAMFNSRMEEVLTGQVRIIGVDPETFDIFLRFLYQGQLKNCDGDMRRKLYAVADRYQVETLMQICRPTAAAGCVDVENMMDAFLTC